MRYTMIMAGGSGTRLWPMSRSALPKQLIPFIDGKSLLQIAFERFDGLVPVENRYVCAGMGHKEAILSGVPSLGQAQFLGEPVGRDTLGAVGLSAAVLAKRDPEAVIGVFTADHLITPLDVFQKAIAEGFELVERFPETLVTFGIGPTGPATSFGYLELGPTIEGNARMVQEFREKPPLETAREYFEQGPDRYLWNSGMFVWRAQTLLDCIRRYEPTVWDGLMSIADAWDTPRQDEVLGELFPALKKISVDFAVMEPASQDTAVRVAAIPMKLDWRDIGSWPSFAETLPRDENGNSLAIEKHVLHETSGTLLASDDPDHLIATIGCEDMVVIHTKNATLVCRADMAEKIKDVQKTVQERFGNEYT
jgi:mannose-1-phosphate guanylyltransferase